MSEEARPPVAIRITRPQASEEEFLEQELETVTRASVTLLGAQPRPQGVVLRFELALASGAVLLRGEGRVTAFKPNALHGLGGLTLRFTRLDSRSKALVDKAAALRDARRPSAMPPPVETPPPVPVPPPPLSSEPTLSSPPDSEPPDSSPTVSQPRPGLAAAPAVEALPPQPPPAEPVAPPPPPPAAAAPSAPSRPPEPASPEREALLERLRLRAKHLDEGTVRRILDRRRAN